MAFFTVEESFYLQQKLDQLKALDSAQYGAWTTTEVADAFEKAGLTAQQHFDKYGWSEQLSANSTFNVKAYLEAKGQSFTPALSVKEVIEAFVANGLSVQDHYTKYGEAEIARGDFKFEPGQSTPSTLTEALAKLAAANKDKADFLAGLKYQGVEAGKADEANVDSAFDTAAGAIVAKAPGADYEDLTKTSLQDTAMSTAKTKAEAELTLASATAKPGMTALIQAAEAAKKAYQDAVTASDKADTNLSAEVSAFGVANPGKTIVYAADYDATSTSYTANHIVIANGKAYQAVAGTATPLSQLAQITTVARVAELSAAKNAAVAALSTENSLFGSLQTAVGAIYVLEAGGHSIKGTISATAVPTTGEYVLTAGDVAVFKTAADAKKDVVSQEITFTGLTAPTGANPTATKLTIAGVPVDLGTSDLTPAQVATKVETAFASNADWTVSGDASTGKLTFTAKTSSVQEIESADISVTLGTDDAAGSAALNAPTPSAATVVNVGTVVTAAASNADSLKTKLTALTTLEKAIADFQNARETKIELEELKKAITAATEAITDSVEDGGLGVSLRADGADFTTANDVYLFNAEVDDAEELANFGLRGEDKIYFGEGFTFVALGDKSIEGKVGDAAVLEIFWKQVGANVELYVEQEAFAGNVAGNNDDIITITLTGVSADSINFDGTYLVAGTAI